MTSLFDGTHPNCNYLATSGYCNKCGWFAPEIGVDLAKENDDRTMAAIASRFTPAKDPIAEIHDVIKQRSKAQREAPPPILFHASPYIDGPTWEQFRFPRSKKRRIRKKWAKDRRNWRKVHHSYLVDGTRQLICSPEVYAEFEKLSEEGYGHTPDGSSHSDGPPPS